MNNEIRALLRKEFRQIWHKPAAYLTATLLPFFLLLVIPGAMLVFGAGAGSSMISTGGLPIPTAFDSETMTRPGGMVAAFFLPLYVGITGLILPAIMATYTVVVEKEKRTIDLLMALPVSIGDILLSKLYSIIAASLMVTLPLVFADMALLAWQGYVEPLVYVGIVLELLTALAFSSASAILLSLIAKDYRSANNMSAVFMVPMIPALLAAALLITDPVLKLAAISVLFLLMTILLTWIAVNKISLERMAQ